jgi:membrane-associated protease RseP (regulator of RpoE activity)
VTDNKTANPKPRAKPPAPANDEAGDQRQAAIFLGVIMVLAVAGAIYFAMHRKEPATPPAQPPAAQATPVEHSHALKGPRWRHHSPAPVVQEAPPAPPPPPQESGPVDVPSATLTPQPTAAQEATAPSPPPVPKTAPKGSAPPASAFGGVGVRLDSGKSGGVIETVYPDTPAARAGLQPGDVIVGVDGVDVSSMPASNVTTRIKGQDGTAVSLTYIHNGALLTVVLPRVILQPQVFTGESGK